MATLTLSIRKTTTIKGQFFKKRGSTGLEKPYTLSTNYCLYLLIVYLLFTIAWRVILFKHWWKCYLIFKSAEILFNCGIYFYFKSGATHVLCYWIKAQSTHPGKLGRKQDLLAQLSGTSSLQSPLKDIQGCATRCFWLQSTWTVFGLWN